MSSLFSLGAMTIAGSSGLPISAFVRVFYGRDKFPELWVSAKVRFEHYFFAAVFLLFLFPLSLIHDL